MPVPRILHQRDITVLHAVLQAGLGPSPKLLATAARIMGDVVGTSVGAPGAPPGANGATADGMANGSGGAAGVPSASNGERSAREESASPGEWGVRVEVRRRPDSRPCH